MRSGRSDMQVNQLGKDGARRSGVAGIAEPRLVAFLKQNPMLSHRYASSSILCSRFSSGHCGLPQMAESFQH